MTKKQQNTPEEEKQPKYLNLLTDFGFKKMFGEKNKKFLIAFLNSIPHTAHLLHQHPGLQDDGLQRPQQLLLGDPAQGPEEQNFFAANQVLFYRIVYFCAPVQKVGISGIATPLAIHYKKYGRGKYAGMSV